MFTGNKSSFARCCTSLLNKILSCFNLSSNWLNSVMLEVGSSHISEMSSFTSVPLDFTCALNIAKSRCICWTDATKSVSKVNIAEVGKVLLATGVNVL